MSAGFRICERSSNSRPDFVYSRFYKALETAVDASNCGIPQLRCCPPSVSWGRCGTSRLLFFTKFNQPQRSYATIEKETLALVQAVQHFEDYLVASPSPIIVHCDHDPLRFLNHMRNSNQGLTRWSLLLQQFNLEVKHIRGKDNFFADTLSSV